MQSIEWIEKAMKAGNFPSYRQLAIKLNVTEPTMSNHRSGKAKTLNEEHCVAIAEICGIDPAIVIADQLAERATTPAVRKIYQRLGKLATAAGSGVAAGVLATICLALPVKSEANQSIASNRNATMYIMLNKITVIRSSGSILVSSIDSLAFHFTSTS